MSERVKGYVVTLEENLDEEDAACTMTVLRAIKGVADVRPVQTSFEDGMVAIRTRLECAKRLADLAAEMSKL